MYHVAGEDGFVNEQLSNHDLSVDLSFPGYSEHITPLKQRPGLHEEEHPHVAQNYGLAGSQSQKDLNNNFEKRKSTLNAQSRMNLMNNSLDN